MNASLHMPTRHAWPAVLVAALLLACAPALARAAAAPGAAQRSAKVELEFRDPAQIVAHDRSWSDRDEWLDELGRYVVKEASVRVPDGARLLVTITDVQRAGMVQPWRHSLSDVRVVRDSTPPRIELAFRLVAPQGAVLKEGTRNLTDFNFLRRSSFHSGERLGYEKDLIDDWLRRDFGPGRR